MKNQAAKICQAFGNKKSAGKILASSKLILLSVLLSSRCSMFLIKGMVSNSYVLSERAGQREILPYLLRLNRFGKALLADIGLSYLVHT